MAAEREELGPDSRWHRLSAWLDIESAAVVTILLGLFPVMLSASLIQTDLVLPKFFFILPFVLGIVTVAGGSFAMASQKNRSKNLIGGARWCNVAGVLGSVVAFCIYAYALSTARNSESCSDPISCTGEKMLASYCWSQTFQLLLYDIAAVVLHLILSVSAFKTLKTN